MVYTQVAAMEVVRQEMAAADAAVKKLEVGASAAAKALSASQARTFSIHASTYSCCIPGSYLLLDQLHCSFTTRGLRCCCHQRAQPLAKIQSHFL